MWPTQPWEILVVDDDEDIRATLRVLLEDAGYTVHEADDGTSALQRLHASAEPLVVVLDWQMPHMDGQQVLEAVAAHATLATRHAYLLLTADADTLSQAFLALLRQYQTPVLAKPFDLDRLLEVVAQAATRLTNRVHDR